MTTPDEMRAMAERLDILMMRLCVCLDEDIPKVTVELDAWAGEAAAMLRSIAEEREADAKVQNEWRDNILRLKSTMVKNGWIEA